MPNLFNGNKFQGQNMGFQGGYNTAPNMGEHLASPYDTQDFNNMNPQ